MLKQRAAIDGGGEPCPAAPKTVEEFCRVGVGQLRECLPWLGLQLAVRLAAGCLNPHTRRREALAALSTRECTPGCGDAMLYCKCSGQSPVLAQVPMAALRPQAS